MARIQLNGVRKSFGGVHVIKGVDLDIRAGEFMVFVGPSGCGKSTLLRLIAGLEDITSGEMRFDDQRMNDKTPSERGIAMVFQSYALYPHMSVYDNMAFGLRLAKGEEAETRKRVERAAEMLQIKQYLERLPKQLSGGQRQRVAIGRAIVRDPRVFLFDEPLSNLDAALRVATRLEIAKLHHDMGKATMIYVTHDQVEAMTLADRICVLRDGLVEQVGTPLELYEKPASVFVAGFIGSPKMNFFSGAHASPLGAHTIGVRPEHLVAAPEKAGTWSGQVAHREVMGSDTYLYIDVGGPELITLRETGISGRNPGDSIALTPMAPHYVHRFDEAGRPV
ncbi:ABC transporter ATP-binding protein [Neomegalonema sp.]|uniref:ABC transporter ATP-binding protein n=1 Tax=Neomegalonema sp. TaxID=2039713 RepID=UPI00262FBCDF|nr:ABC transporter ATP-binding protein [Neomegalonema sp.]MDD2868661.1 ABC transporter ATP-binding protein [Neomegalonema sp.]